MTLYVQIRECNYQCVVLEAQSPWRCWRPKLCVRTSMTGQGWECVLCWVKLWFGCTLSAVWADALMSYLHSMPHYELFAICSAMNLTCPHGHECLNCTVHLYPQSLLASTQQAIPTQDSTKNHCPISLKYVGINLVNKIIWVNVLPVNWYWCKNAMKVIMHASGSRSMCACKSSIEHYLRLLRRWWTWNFLAGMCDKFSKWKRVR